jgi:hypothetical protein
VVVHRFSSRGRPEGGFRDAALQQVLDPRVNGFLQPIPRRR